MLSDELHSSVTYLLRYLFDREHEAMASRTGAQRYFDQQLKDPEYRNAYEEASERIRRADSLVRSLDERRQAKGLSKAELARQACIAPEAVRRLFSMRSPNPTAATLVALAAALEMDVVAVPRKDRSPATTAPRRDRAQGPRRSEDRLVTSTQDTAVCPELGPVGRSPSPHGRRLW